MSNNTIQSVGTIKVLSVKEPHASMIKEGQFKHIETRSWRTNYRGELYIHASKSKVTKQIMTEHNGMFNLLQNTDFDYGCIIAKCKLVDCVYMTEEFIEEVKKNPNEYISGFYSVGRYAWILEDIEMLEKPIPVAGNRSIWKHTAQSVQKTA